MTHIIWDTDREYAGSSFKIDSSQVQILLLHPLHPSMQWAWHGQSENFLFQSFEPEIGAKDFTVWTVDLISATNLSAIEIVSIAFFITFNHIQDTFICTFQSQFIIPKNNNFMSAIIFANFSFSVSFKCNDYVIVRIELMVTNDPLEVIFKLIY